MKSYKLAVVAATILTGFVVTTGAFVAATRAVLPNGWVLAPAPPLMTETDTMPQGAAASPDGKILAVVESGFNPPTLRFYGTNDLNQLASVPLKGAFGRPVWMDGGHVLVAGANADALFVVDVAKQSVQTVPMPAHSYPVYVAMGATGLIAVATDGDAALRIGHLDDVAKVSPVKIGGHIGGLTFTPDGSNAIASNRAASSIAIVDAKTLQARTVATGLHPSDILVVGGTAYVAETDADGVGTYDVATGAKTGSIFVGEPIGAGVSPNALARRGDTLFVSLGAANEIAVIKDGKVVGRIAAGWYPTDVVPGATHLYAIDGKGEGTVPNPFFNAKKRSFYDYVGALQFGSIRALAYDQSSWTAAPQGAQGWMASGSSPVVRSNGPIRHVFFILKENRSYDQVLGDVAGGNGDRKLVWFGERVTPNEHAMAQRFGLFDNTYASGEVSEPGHNWADAAFVNDFVERTWPPNYGDRGGRDDTLTGVGAGVPRNGYIWQTARAAKVSFRDYGELTDTPNLTGIGTTSAPSLHGLYDPKYVGWNLDYSDLDRLKEWRREFSAFLAQGNVPQLEYIWLPNDHTSGSRPGKPTPVAYVATNDYALGQIVDTISHSSIWKSSAIFIIEDDAQDGPDHVSAQRTTFFLVSPYAKGGVIHDHYSTVSILRTMEIILGLKQLSTYDAMAVPMSDAFTTTPRLAPYFAISPQVDITARNSEKAYGSKVSVKLDFTRPDATPLGIMETILAHNHSLK